MAQETNILIQVSTDEATWTDLATIASNSTFYTDAGIAIGGQKYYRLIAKGDGINTLDSEPTPAVNITNGFCTEYQAVLDAATTAAIAHPSLAQNIINDTIVRLLKQIGKWTKFDVFFYFKQATGTPYDFLRIDWRNPTRKLTNLGAAPVDFIGGLGLKATGAGNQYMNMNWTASTQAVNFSNTNSVVIFSLFDTVKTAQGTIFGATSNDSSGRMIAYQQANNPMVAAVNADNNPLVSPVPTDINQHYQLSPTKVFLSGSLYNSPARTATTALSSVSTYLFGQNFKGSPFATTSPVGLKYFAIGGNMQYADRDLYNILNQNFINAPVQKPGALAFSYPTTVSTETIAHVIVKLSSEFPTMNTTKKYCVFWSTDHAPLSGGACMFGEADTPDLQGFIERGAMVTGNQSETPFPIHNPNDPNGQPVWLFYHPAGTHPDSDGKQQTRLLTRASGNFNDPGGWTDRGKVLGITAFETANFTEIHTGYLTVYPQGDGSLIGLHVTEGMTSAPNGVPRLGKSTNPGNVYPWTRETSDIDVTSFMSHRRQCHYSPSLYFTRNAVQYMATKSVTYDFDMTTSLICIYECVAGDFKPTSQKMTISTPDGGNAHTGVSFYAENDTLFIYYIINEVEVYTTVWDLKNLD